jgi:hypothetical protein
MKVALENDCVDVLAHALVTSLKISKVILFVFLPLCSDLKITTLAATRGR